VTLFGVSLGDIVAIGISIIALIVAGQSAKKANALQSEMVELEKRRDKKSEVAASQAALRAQFNESGSSYMLSITNHGQAVARDLEVFVEGGSIALVGLVANGQDKFDRIGPGAKVEYRFIAYDGMQRRYNVRLRWDDDSAKDRSWESQLTLP
jgi:hypothetical protein